MSAPINDDPWAVTERSDGPSKDALAALPFMQVEELGSVAPLDVQICVASKLSVPPPLRPAIFGQVDAGQNLATYAILDAARIPNLPEILAQGTARHECLFKGAAYDDWGHVAPWLVALDESDVLTRRLFTRGQAAWHLWDNQAGIFLRSALDIISHQRHFRKFTRAVDRQGRWHYLRFYDPAYLTDYVSSLGPEKFLKFTAGIDSMIIARPGRSAVIRIFSNTYSSSSKNTRRTGK